MDDCIAVSEYSGSLNIRSWCAAILWSMMPEDLSYPTCVSQFIDAWCMSVRDFLPSPLPPLAPDFRDAIRDSGHTCWEYWPSWEDEKDREKWEEKIDGYAAAMAFLDEDPKVVGIDVQKNSGCQACHLQWRLRNLGETLPREEQAFSGNLTELLVSLGNECSRWNVPWNDILTSVQKELGGDRESADAAGRPPFANLPSQIPQPYSRSQVLADRDFTFFPRSTCPVNVDEASNLFSVSDVNPYDSALHVPLSASHQPRPIQDTTNTHSSYQSYQDGNPISWPRDSNEGSNPINGQGRGYIDRWSDGYDVLKSLPPQTHEAVDDAADHTMWGSNHGPGVRRDDPSMESFEPGYPISENEQDPNWTRLTRMSVSNLVESVPDYEQSIHYDVVPQTSSSNYPTYTRRESWRNTYLNPEQGMQSVLPARKDTHTDNITRFTQSETITSQPAINPDHNHRMMSSSDISLPADPLPPRQEMIDKIKMFLTDAMEKHGIHLQYKESEWRIGQQG
ncbi:hypothetical protein C8J56DRAFT_960612 [Mycena floridula]|nr:hypothetical protein C8J56DRAFT_960612 [Mycena floridula]